MAKAKKLPSGNWRCRASFTDANGVQHKESFTEPTAKKAEAKAAMWQAGMLEKKKNGPRQELGEAMDEYIETCRCTGLSPSTIKSYVSARENAYARLIKRPVDLISVRDVQMWVNERSKVVTPKTVKNNLGLLSVVFKSCSIKFDFEAIKLPKVEQDEVVIPSDSQIATMLTAAYDDDDLYIAAMLAALMGLRRSEICALRWSDIKISSDGTAYLSVDKALVVDENNRHVEKSPKTRAGKRILPIPSAVYDELKRRRSLRPTLISVTPNVITARYMRLCKELGLPTRFHGLRHYHASVMLREGVPEKYIVADMGHASFDMVKRVYGHVMQEKLGAISTAMDAHASSVLRIDTTFATAGKKC